MRNIIKYVMILISAYLVSGCEEESSVRIDSVSALGDEFYYGQKVRVWTVIETNDLPAARYTWNCEGGRITQPQGLDENIWEAPREPGTYRVTCTVNVNGTKQTRSRSMFVSSYFFEKFERTSQNAFTFNSSSNTVKEGHLEVRVSSASATRGYVQRAFNDQNLTPPVSAQMQTGWISNFPADQIKIGNNTAQNTLYYEWTLNRDPDKEDNLFIDNIRFEWYPVGKSSGLPLDPNAQEYNGWLRFQQRNVATNVATAFQVYVNHPDLSFAQGQYKNVSLTLDADYVVHVYVQGVEVLKTDAIKTWRTDNMSKDDIYVNQWRLNYVSNSGQTPLIYIDNAYTLTDGNILK